MAARNSADGFEINGKPLCGCNADPQVEKDGLCASYECPECGAFAEVVQGPTP